MKKLVLLLFLLAPLLSYAGRFIESSLGTATDNKIEKDSLDNAISLYSSSTPKSVYAKLPIGRDVINHVNRNWGMSKEKVKSSQSKNSNLIEENESDVLYKTVLDGSVNVYISYNFDSDNKLS